MRKELKAATNKEVLAEIKRFQNQQKRYPTTSQVSQDIGSMLLAPLFAEMARRQAAGGAA